MVVKFQIINRKFVHRKKNLVIRSVVIAQSEEKKLHKNGQEVKMVRFVNLVLLRPKFQELEIVFVKKKTFLDYEMDMYIYSV